VYRLKIECTVEVQGSKYLLVVEETKFGKTNTCLMKVCMVNDREIHGEKLEDISGKITKARLEIHDNAKIIKKKDSKSLITVIEIIPIK